MLLVSTTVAQSLSPLLCIDGTGKKQARGEPAENTGVLFFFFGFFFLSQKTRPG